MIFICRAEAKALQPAQKMQETKRKNPSADYLWIFSFESQSEFAVVSQTAKIKITTRRRRRAGFVWFLPNSAYTLLPDSLWSQD